MSCVVTEIGESRIVSSCRGADGAYGGGGAKLAKLSELDLRAFAGGGGRGVVVVPAGSIVVNWPLRLETSRMEVGWEGWGGEGWGTQRIPGAALGRWKAERRALFSATKV